MRRFLATAVFGACVLIAMPAGAEQFVAADVTYVHSTQNTSHSHYYLKPSAATPPSWRSPVDYTTGTVYMHLEVETKPTSDAAKIHVCFIQGNPGYACSTYSSPFTAPGTYRWTANVVSLSRNGIVDWAKGIPSLTIILTDASPRNVGVEDVGPEIAARFMPTRMRVVITVVSAGGPYVPPLASADGGVPADGPSSRIDAAAVDRLFSTEAAPPPATPEPATSPALPPQGTEPPALPPAPAPSATQPPRAPTSDPVADRTLPNPGQSGGCAVTGGGPAPAGLVLISLAALLAHRLTKERKTLSPA